MEKRLAQREVKEEEMVEPVTDWNEKGGSKSDVGLGRWVDSGASAQGRPGRGARVWPIPPASSLKKAL